MSHFDQMWQIWQKMKYQTVSWGICPDGLNWPQFCPTCTRRQILNFSTSFFARNLNSCKSYKLLFSQTQYIMQQRRKKGANMILIIETGYDGSLSTGLSRQIIWCRLAETVEWWKRRQRCFWAPRAWISQNLVFFSVLKMFWKYKLIFLSAWPSRLACSLDGCFDAQPKRLRGLT